MKTIAVEKGRERRNRLATGMSSTIVLIESVMGARKGLEQRVDSAPTEKEDK